MPDVFHPRDGQPWPQERFYRDAPTWAGSGVLGSPPIPASGTTHQVGDMALSFSVAGSVITVQMATGRARVRGMLYERTDALWSSGAAGNQPTPGSAAYPLNTGSNPRRDRLVLRRDLNAGLCYPVVKIGTPAASNPQNPALTQVENGVWEEVLHSWALPGNSSLTPTAIVDERAWLHPGGNSGPLFGIDLKKTTLQAIGNGTAENQGFAATDVVRDRGGYYTGSGQPSVTVPANLGGKYIGLIGGGVDGGPVASRLLFTLDGNGEEMLRANGYGEDVAWASRELWLPGGSTVGMRALQGRGTGRSITSLHLSLHLIGS